MKLLLLTLSLFLSNSMFAVTVIRGFVANIKDTTANLGIQYFPGYTQYDSSKTITVPIKNGAFEIRTDAIVDSITFCQFHIGHENFLLHLCPGDSIVINITDYYQFDETIKFTGRGASKNNFNAMSFLKFKVRRSNARLSTNPAILSSSNLTNGCDSRLRLLEQYQTNERLEPPFYRMQKNRIFAEYGQLLLKYAIVNVDSGLVIDTIKNILNDLKIVDDRYSQYPFFKGFVEWFVKWKANENKLSIVQAAETYLPGRNLEYFLADYIRKSLRRGSVAESKNIYQQIEGHLSNIPFKETIRKRIHFLDSLAILHPVRDIANKKYMIDTTTVIEGIISNFPSHLSKNKISIYFNNVPHTSTDTKKIKVNPNGSFSLTVSMYRPCFISIGNHFGDNVFMLLPGERVFLVLDYLKSGIVFLGDNAALHSLVHQYVNEKSSFGNATASDNTVKSKIKAYWMDVKFSEFFSRMHPSNREFDKIVQYSNDLQYVFGMDSWYVKSPGFEFKVPKSLETISDEITSSMFYDFFAYQYNTKKGKINKFVSNRLFKDTYLTDIMFEKVQNSSKRKALKFIKANISVIQNPDLKMMFIKNYELLSKSTYKPVATL
jgi:hypothetical protein